MGKYVKVAIPLFLLALLNFAWVAFIWHLRKNGVSDPDFAQMVESDFTAFLLPWSLLFVLMVYVFGRIDLYDGLAYPKIGRVLTALLLIFLSETAVEFAGLSPRSSWGLITINQYDGPAGRR